MPKHTLTLITGGARSGKSRFAQQIGQQSTTDVLFVATAEAHDDDMATRIARHQAERPTHWRTLETPRAPAEALRRVEPAALVILDCMTLWVTNLLLAEQSSWAEAEAELDDLVAWHSAGTSELIIVSNEVGLGIVPADPLSRDFREWLGRFNQRVASVADEVYLMVAGLAVELKALIKQRH